MSEHEADILEILQRMQQQLTFLEKKVDTVIQQTTQRKPAFGNGGGNFSRPFRPFNRPNRPDGHGPSHGNKFVPKKKFFGGHGHGPQGGGNRPH